MKIPISYRLVLLCCFGLSLSHLNAQNVGIGTTTPLKKLDVQGLGGLRVSTTNAGVDVSDWIAGNFGGSVGDRIVMGLLGGKATVGAHNNALDAWTKLYLAPLGGINIGSLAGTGNRMVVADANGDLLTQTIPTGNAGTVTNVLAGSTSGNPISVTNGTSTPTIEILSANATRNGYLSSTDWLNFNNKFSLPSFTVGSLLFADGTSLAQNNSKLFWNNTSNRLGIGTNMPAKTLDINGIGGLKANSSNTGMGTVDWIAGDFGGTAGDRVVMGVFNGKATVAAHDQALGNWAKLFISPTGGVNIGSLAGTGDRMVVASTTGDLSTQTIPSGADHLGNHTATQALNLNNNWISNNATTTGIRVDNAGNTGINLASPQGVLDVPRAEQTYTQNYTEVPEPASWITGFGLPLVFCNTCGDGHLESWRRAFDNNTSTYSGLSLNSTGTTFYIGQDYLRTDRNPNPPGPRVIRRYRIVIRNHYNIGNIGVTYGFYGSNSAPNGVDAVLLHSNTITAANIDQTHTLSNTNAYRFYFIAIRSEDFSYNVYQGQSDRPHVTDLYFFEEGTAINQISGAFTVKSDGKVGVGTNAPSANLDVTGTVRLRNGAAAGAILTSDASGNASWSSGFTATGGLKVSSTNNGTGTNDWIALNAGNSATGSSSSTDRFVAGNVNGSVTIGAHNKDLNTWTNLSINSGGSATVTIGADANTTPPIGGTGTSVARKLIVNGSIRQGYYGLSTGVIPANNIVTITWTHNLGYNPIVMTSLDQTGGGYYMDFCNVVTTSPNSNQVNFIIRNLGNQDALGSLRWILVW